MHNEVIELLHYRRQSVLTPDSLRKIGFNGRHLAIALHPSYGMAQHGALARRLGLVFEDPQHGMRQPARPTIWAIESKGQTSRRWRRMRQRRTANRTCVGRHKVTQSS